MESSTKHFQDMSADELLAEAQRLEGLQSTAQALRQLAQLKQQQTQLLAALPGPSEMPAAPAAAGVQSGASIADYVSSSWPGVFGSMDTMSKVS